MKRQIRRIGLILGGLIIWGLGSVWAVEPTDAPDGSGADVIGAQINQDAQARLLEEQPPQAVRIEPEERKPRPKDEVVFQVNKIILEGDFEGDFGTLDRLVAKYEQRKVSMREINELSQLIEQHYRNLGYFVVAFIPPQKAKGGEIRLRVLASRMGSLEVQGNRYFRKSKIKSYWKIPEGEILKFDQIRQSVLELNQNPDRQVKPVLRAGNVEGTTDILLNVKDQFPWHVGYTFDNRGVKLTGRERHGFTLRSNNALGLDDTFIIGTTFGEEFGSLYLQHLIPVGTAGTRLIWGFSHSQSNPKKEFERFGINGISQTYNLSVRQRLYRSARISLEGYVGFDIKEKKTRVLSVTSVRDRLRILSWGFSGQLRDKWGGWSAKQDFYYGFPIPNGDGFALNSRGAETQFFKYGYSLERYQKMPFGTHVKAKMRGQLSDSRLMPQEQMFFGGVSSVRGYPESDFLADQGIIINVDYKIPVSTFIKRKWKLPYAEKSLAERTTLLAFYDYGYGRINDPSATDRHTRKLMGAGVGIEAKFRKHLTGTFQWGFPFGDEPITESGNSQYYFRVAADI